MPNFPKKQQQCLIPKYLLDYATELEENHPDPSASWGGGSGGGDTIQAGEGIVITTESDDTKTISVDTEDVAMVSDLSNVAFSGSYNDLTNKPTIPTKTSQLTNDSNYIPSSTANDKIYSVRYTVPFGNWYEQIHYESGGIYFECTNNSTFLAFDDNGTNMLQTVIIPNESGTLALTSDIITSYNDLTNKPYIPTVNNKTITIQKNGTTVDSFTLNQSTNKTINISVPTDTSDLTNGAGYITGITSSDVTTALGYTPYNSSNPSGYITGITSGMVTTALGYTPGTSNFSGDYDDLTDKPSIPSTATSTSTSTVTPSTTSVVNGVTYTPATETLVFTYTDNTTATITLLTSSTTVTPSTATVMTGATVSTTTTTTLS